MGTKLSRALDECLEQVGNHQSIEGCLAEYPAMRRQLEPLLHTALSITATPKVSPSDEFKAILKARLKARLSEDRVPAEAVKPRRRIAGLTVLSAMWQRLVHALTISRKVVIPVAATLLLVVASAIYVFWAPSSTSPVASLVSKCTLSIISGSVEWQNSGSAVWEKATDGLTLEAGNWVRTGADSAALLTFFEGSTLRLDANTEVEIQQVESSGEQNSVIVLRQWLGRTWSRVVKMIDPGSRYEIETPSASAIVRGTFFMTEVDASGLTTVQTFEGLVAVEAQTDAAPTVVATEPVNVPAGYETRVEFEGTPCLPTPIETPVQVPGEQDSQDQNDDDEDQDSEGQDWEWQGDNDPSDENNSNGDENRGSKSHGNNDQDNNDQGRGNKSHGNNDQDNNDQGRGNKSHGNSGGGHNNNGGDQGHGGRGRSSPSRGR